MNIRSVLNGLLRPCGFEVVKTCGADAALCLHGGQSFGDETVARKVASNRKHVWIVAPPKSGSTWFTALLSQLLGWPQVPLVNGYDRREQEVDLLRILSHPGVDILSPHQHCRASQPTVDFIKKFSVIPIIQTRNVLDSVVSVRDHLTNEARTFSMAYIDDRFLELTEERQYDFIVEMFAPWFFSFYASWFSVEEEVRNRLHFVRYEDLVAGTPGVLRQTLRFIDEGRSQDEVDQAIARVKIMHTRKNKGVTGRGDALLNDRQKAKIREYREYYDHLDFSMIGL